MRTTMAGGLNAWACNIFFLARTTRRRCSEQDDGTWQLASAYSGIQRMMLVPNSAVQFDCHPWSIR
jgi:hypothetical protein